MLLRNDEYGVEETISLNVNVSEIKVLLINLEDIKQLVLESIEEQSNNYK